MPHVCQKLTSFYSSIGKSIAKLFRTQIRMLFQDFDLVKNGRFIYTEPNNGKHFQPQFLCAIILLLIGVFYGVIGVDDRIQFGQMFSLQYYRNSPYLYHRMFLPRSSWRQSEIVLGYMLAQTFASYVIFMLTFRLAKNQIMYAQSDGHIIQAGHYLNRRVSKAILNYRRRAKKYIRRIYLFFLLNSLVFTYLKLFKHPIFKFTLRQGLFWFCLFPWKILYYIFGLYSFNCLISPFLNFSYSKRSCNNHISLLDPES